MPSKVQVGIDFGCANRMHAHTHTTRLLLYLTCLEVTLSKFEGHPSDTPTYINQYPISTFSYDLNAFIRSTIRLSEICMLTTSFRRYPICVSLYYCRDVWPGSLQREKSDEKTGV